MLTIKDDLVLPDQVRNHVRAISELTGLRFEAHYQSNSILPVRMNVFFDDKDILTMAAVDVYDLADKLYYYYLGMVDARRAQEARA